MEETRYGLKVGVEIPYEQAVARATDALKSPGFGVLTTIDVKATLEAKLNRDFRKYVILGACNPPLADRALSAELDIGLLLPCNVVVYEVNPSLAVVAALAPLAALGIVGENPSLHRCAGGRRTVAKRASRARRAGRRRRHRRAVMPQMSKDAAVGDRGRGRSIASPPRGVTSCVY